MGTSPHEKIPETRTEQGKEYGDMRLCFYLDDEMDESLIAWWLSLPKGQRSMTMRQMMRWYSGQQGFSAVIAAIQHLTAPGMLAITPPEHELVLPPNTAELMTDAFDQFGWNDDEESESHGDRDRIG